MFKKDKQTCEEWEHISVAPDVSLDDYIPPSLSSYDFSEYHHEVKGNFPPITSAASGNFSEWSVVGQSSSKHPHQSNENKNKNSNDNTSSSVVSSSSILHGHQKSSSDGLGTHSSTSAPAAPLEKSRKGISNFLRLEIPSVRSGTAEEMNGKGKREKGNASLQVSAKSKTPVSAPVLQNEEKEFVFRNDRNAEVHSHMSHQDSFEEAVRNNSDMKTSSSEEYDFAVVQQNSNSNQNPTILASSFPPKNMHRKRSQSEEDFSTIDVKSPSHSYTSHHFNDSFLMGNSASFDLFSESSRPAPFSKEGSISFAAPFEESYSRTIRVLTYNINWGFCRMGLPSQTPGKICNAIKEANAHIICLQETHHGWQQFLGPKFMSTHPYQAYKHHSMDIIKHLEEIGSLANQQELQQSKLAGESATASMAGGLAIFSKYPFRELFYEQPNVTGSFFPGWLIEVTVEDTIVHVLNVHLRPPISDGHKPSLRAYFQTSSVRKAELQFFMDKTLEQLALREHQQNHHTQYHGYNEKYHQPEIGKDIPFIVCGDFNEGHDGSAISWLKQDKQGFGDALSDFAPSEKTWKWPLKFGLSLRGAYDHIMYTKSKMHAVSCSVMSKYEYVSDHIPVVAEIAFKEALIQDSRSSMAPLRKKDPQEPANDTHSITQRHNVQNDDSFINSSASTQTQEKYTLTSAIEVDNHPLQRTVGSEETDETIDKHSETQIRDASALESRMNKIGVNNAHDFPLDKSYTHILLKDGSDSDDFYNDSFVDDIGRSFEAAGGKNTSEVYFDLDQNEFGECSGDLEKCIELISLDRREHMK